MTKNIIIELKNGDKISGVLSKIDSFLNVKLTNCLYNQKKLEEIFIRGNNICSFQFPENTLEEVKYKELKEIYNKKCSGKNQDKKHMESKVKNNEKYSKISKYIGKKRNRNESE